MADAKDDAVQPAVEAVDITDFDPTAYIDSIKSSLPQAPPTVVEPASGQAEAMDFNPDEYIQQVKEEKYGTPGQQVTTAIEGAAQGVLGPLAPALLRVGGVRPAEMRARQEVNPITFGVAEAGALAAGAMRGQGAGGALTKAGTLAQEALGLEKAATLGSKVGSIAAQQAAEMAVYQSGSEVSKLILQDPDQSAQTALSNIGLAAALGGAGGAILEGAVSPLWKATAGPQVDKFLGGLKDHLNGQGLTLTEDGQKAVKTLGIELPPEMKAAMSGDPNAAQMFNELREVQHKAVTQSIKDTNAAVEKSVLDSLGITPESVEVFSENQVGHETLDAFKREYSAKYEPIQEQLNIRNQAAASIPIGDERRLSQYGKIIEQGMKQVGTDSPAYKLYNDWGNRLLAKEEIGGIDVLKTEIGKEIRKAKRISDFNTSDALIDIKNMMSDFQEQEIRRAALGLERAGVDDAINIGEDLLAQRAAANKGYAEFSRMSNDLSSHLGVGDFSGFKTLTNKLDEGVTAESLLKKFSPKNNADIIPFLQAHFPETLEIVRQNELRQLVKSAVLGAKDGSTINMKTLSNMISKGMSGKEEYLRWALPPEALEKIMAADVLQNAIPGMKSSGTAGWQQKMMASVPQSAGALIAMMTGHNPAVGFVGGYLGKLMARDAPDAMKLAMLRFLASDQPVKAEGFKAMVDFMHNVAKGESVMNNGIKSIFKAGVATNVDDFIPSDKAETQKLDKAVIRAQKNPETLLNLAKNDTGHYLPGHQAAMTQTAVTAVNYLASLKPAPQLNGPLDRPIPPSASQVQRYNRALSIGQNPYVVLNRIKAGTLQTTDIQDLNAMYPGLYQRMSAKLTTAITDAKAKGTVIPYKTRIGMSLFLGQPLDSSMSPTSIMAAQPQPTQPPGQGSAQHASEGKPSAIKKLPASYQTPAQAADKARASRD